MRFSVRHETRGRIRVHMLQKRQMTCREADLLLLYLQEQEIVCEAKVYERTGDAAICYRGDRETIIHLLQRFHYEAVEAPTGYLEHSGRELNSTYQEKLTGQILSHFARKLFLPAPLAAAWTGMKSVKYIWNGVRTLARRRMEVPVLDAAAIGASVFRGDFATAGSIMLLLGIGETLEEWTHKKSVGDLARTMSLNVGKVWMLREGQEVLVSAKEIREGDRIVVHMGTVIPFDGEVQAGEAMVNQASLTGESVPVRRTEGSFVYAGTVVEEGELTVLVKQSGGVSRYEKITAMIEESEKLKSGLESRAEHLADQLVPWSLGGTALTYLLTRNATKALSILMVDFSCALKLAMPISVLSAIREASHYQITVKGGKFLEAVAEADTIVFDKTGTLTEARPTVVRVIPFTDEKETELLRMAACMEEHFPHSMAKAVVRAASERGLDHEELHSRVEYVVAHGISTSIEGKKAVIGSYHFVFEDEQCSIPEGREEQFRSLPMEYSHLYLAIEGQLAAVICIEDPLRREAPEVLRRLKQAGFRKIVMMTGDSEHTARVIAEKVGADEYYAEVLPEDKARFVEEQKALGGKVLMVGDGINDSPALSASDAGIAISDGAEIAREVADITVSADSLRSILVLRELSTALMRRIRSNYRVIVSFNLGLILLGAGGVLSPTASALLHNTSTLAIGMKSMQNLLEEGSGSASQQ